ncbi:MAG: DNA polymerase III subunit delta' [Deltaproteobacteria bacterium]|nr:DNA polymerase III subunit delta' [Deltaproteobacteria bacterium]MBW2219039.1 DNA polymerase III subunit delta' [Deltaproteobacteria bacterium]
MPETKPLPKLESLIDQRNAVKNLTSVIRRDTIPHAFLFTGNEGAGKRTAAITFVMACNCDENRIVSSFSEASIDKVTGSCGKCRSCRKILSGNHPDVIFIKPSGTFIKISQIRELCAQLAVKPYEKGYRAVIISDAGTMNKEAGNALLKILEEPPERTIIILTAFQMSDLLPTIVSRCRHVRFSPVSKEKISSFLTKKHGVDVGRANVIASMAEGSFTRALEMNKGNWLHVRRRLIQEMEELQSGRILPCLMFAERLAGKKELVQYSLEIIKNWFRDLIVYKYSPEKVLNQDLVERVEAASEKVEVKTLMSKIRAIQKAQKAIDANANLRLTLENFAMEIVSLRQ